MYTIDISATDFGVLAADILENAHELRLCARGLSMVPFIQDGEILVVQAGKAARRGDIVLCRLDNGRILAHRVLRVEQERGHASPSALLIQGDALGRPDGLVPLDAVLGRVTAVERDGRRIAMDSGLQRWLGLLWAVLPPLCRRLVAAFCKRLRVCALFQTISLTAPR